MEKSHYLRYKVYCEEKRFIDPEKFPDLLEWDEFDQISTHFSFYGNETSPSGYARLVESETMYDLPMFKFGVKIEKDFRANPSERVNEVSRAIVRQDYRHGLNQSFDVFRESHGLVSPPVRKPSDLIQYKIYRLICQRSLSTGTRWSVVAVEESFFKKLNLMGMPMRQIGPTTDYFGDVIPCAMDHHEMWEKLEKSNPQVWEFFKCQHPDLDMEVVLPSDWKQPVTGNRAVEEAEHVLF